MKIVNKYQHRDYVRLGAWGDPQCYQCRECGHKYEIHSGIRSHIKRQHSQ